MSLVVCNLPKAGLGNQLFPLMRALVFAHLNKLSFVIIGYHQIKIGPYLRGERSKRKYLGCFNFEKNVLGELIDSMKILLMKMTGYAVISEPRVAVLKVTNLTIYEFALLPHWSDYFDQLKDHRALVIELFWDILRDQIKSKLISLPAPDIGVHVRLGDFRKLSSNENFANVGAVRTPQEYFVETIRSIRQMSRTELPVSIFTDGYKTEIEAILKLDNITIIEGNNDIIDLLLLSKSKIIVTSAGGTFSYWAGFLSEAPIIMHPDHIHHPIRSKETLKEVYEGRMNEDDELLVRYIQSLGVN